MGGGGVQKHDGHSGNVDQTSNIKRDVYRYLDQNPLLKPKQLCVLLELDYAYYRGYVTRLRSQWKHDPLKQRGSICSNVHGWRGWCYLPEGVRADIQGQAVKAGWVQTRARNRWLLWKDGLGRLQWFGTGRVNIWARKPVTKGRVYQLLSNAFSWTHLITDLTVMETVLASVRFKGAHYVFETNARLPRFTIDLFDKSNGIIVKVGDRSHPHAIEVMAHYPDWGEKSERALDRLLTVFEKLAGGLEKPARKLERDYSR